MALGFRSNQRIPVKLQAALLSPDGLTLEVKIHNLSASGLYCDSPLIALSPYSLLQFHFEVAQRPYELQGMVVHNHEKGMGVMFKDPQHSLLATLRNDPIPSSAITTRC